MVVSPTAKRGTLQHIAGLLLALSTIVVLASGCLHLTLVSHGLCAAHGGMHHSAANETKHETKQTNPATHGPHIEARDHDDHEHCTAHGTLGLPLAPPPAPVLTNVLARPGAAPMPALPAWAKASPLLTAPKTSPPAV